MEILKQFYKKAPTQLKNTVLNAHGTAKYLAGDNLVQLNLIEFDYATSALLRSGSLKDNEANLSKLDALLKQNSLEATSPAALLLFNSLVKLIQNNQTQIESKYKNVFSLYSRVLEKVGVKTPSVNPAVTIRLDHHERIVLPLENERNVLITSALPYVNNVPHLGNLIGCVLSADVYARFTRLRGYNTLYICGTDEYGTATETKAIEEGVSCQELCDKYYALHKQTYDWFGIDFDHFGRTTTQKQTEISQDIYLNLEKHGKILEDTVTQLYCEQHQSFLADRFVEGTCPLCKYDDARGDQCDGCGKLLNAVELINPHCKLDKATPVIRDSKHLFLNLTEEQGNLESWFRKASTEGAWSSNSEQITTSWLKEGLKPRCITRDLKWGTPVPRDGFENKVFYVWFDAPIGYLSITANYTTEWEKWWKNPEHVKLYQFMGKDNVPFHTVLFPSTLIGTQQKWTLLHHLSTTEYLQYETGKFSKSRGVGVFGNNVMDSKIPVEVWRYYLLSQRPETSDSQFTWDGFAAANNNELLANFGNFVNRVAKFLNAKYDGVIPEPRFRETENQLVADVNQCLALYVSCLENVKIRQGIRHLMEISSRGNQYLQENKIDNTLFAENREVCDTVVFVAANICYLLSALVYPYMPTTSEKILEIFKLPLRRITDNWSGSDINPGHQIGPAQYLFQKIEDKKIEECRRLYSGQLASKSVEEPPKKSRKAAKSSEPKAPMALTPEMEAVNIRITEQGNLVRKLKTEKADPNEIKKAVDELLKLKGELQSLATK